LGLTFGVTISAELTFILSVAVIIIAFYYILKKWAQGRHSRDPNLEEGVVRSINDQFCNSDNVIRAILEDYSATLEEVGRRDNLTLLTGTILITASFLLLAEAGKNQDSQKIIFALASLGLYLAWLMFFHETAQRLNEIAFQRARAIEHALTRHFHYDFGIHSYITTHTEEGTAPWLRMVRRIFWYVVLLLLAFSWMLLSMSISISIS